MDERIPLTTINKNTMNDQDWISTHPIVTEALHFLSGRCDGAVSTDGFGFNKVDTQFANSLIEQLPELSPNQHVAALRMLWKYQKTQLAAAGIELPSHNELMQWLGNKGDEKLDESEKVSLPKEIEDALEEADFTPTPTQREALILMWKFCTEGRSIGGKYFGLWGFAGAGKSTILQILVNALRKSPKRPVVCMAAPTNKAVRVLQKMAKRAGLIGIDFKTVHQLLQLERDFDETGKEIWVPRVLKKRYDSKTTLVDYDLVLIDETSMIGQSLWEQIQLSMDVVRPDDDTQTQIIAIGDPAQLPPVQRSRTKPKNQQSLAFPGEVDMSTSESEQAPEHESPLFTEIPNSVTLTEVVRYNGQLLQMATDIRENLERGGSPPFRGYVGDSSQIALLDKYEWMEQLLKDYSSPEYNANSAAVRCIAYTNRTVSWMNLKIRRHLLGNDLASEHPYLEGDRLVMLAPVFEGKTPKIPSRSEVEVYEVSESEMIPGSWDDDCKEDLYYRHWRIKAWDEDACPTTLRILHPGSKAEFEKKQKQLHAAAMAIPTIDKEKRRNAWREFYEHKGLFALVDYAFCLTVHSAQGSTFNKVYIPLSDLLLNKRDVERNKLLYTAVTRAANQIVVAV